MKRITPHELQAVTRGRWLAPCDSGAPLGRVVDEARAVEPGDVLWDLAGEADAPLEACRRGASGIVTARCDSELPTDCWVLLVDDAAEALHLAAAAQRKRFCGQVVAVAGSVGKTTTRQMIHTVLSRELRGSYVSGQEQSQLSLPLGMLAWNLDDRYAVVELAANSSEQMAQLAALARPHVAVITGATSPSADAPRDAASPARSNAEVLAALPANGWAVLNGDDAALRRVVPDTAARVCWFGRGGDDDICAEHVSYSAGRLQCTVYGQRLAVPVWGRHHLAAVLAAAAVGKVFGMSWPTVAEALAGFESPARRCQVQRLGAAYVIDDTYSGTPSAMRAALELLREFECGGRRLVVCGEMSAQCESDHWYEQLGEQAVTVGRADRLVACGRHAEAVASGALAAGMPEQFVQICRQPALASAWLARHLEPGDVALVEGASLAAVQGECEPSQPQRQAA